MPSRAQAPGASPLSRGKAQRLTDNPEGNFDPDLSPDGKTLAFSSSRDMQLEVYRMKPDGKEQVRLTQASGDDFKPAKRIPSREITYWDSWGAKR